jgi:hypothetical protein
MAQTIRIKRSTTTSVPTSLTNGELAYSEVSKKLFIGRPGGGTGDIDAIGGKFYTDIVAAATASNTASTLVFRNGSGNFSAGIITAALAGNATTATTLADARTLSLTGDIAYTSPSFDGSTDVTATATLATVNSNVGNFGSTTAIPVVSVNAKGLITAISTVNIATSWNIAGDTGTTNSIEGGETLTVSGGTGVDTVVSANGVAISIGQAVATTSNVTFNDVTVDGVLNTDDVTAANLTASGNVTVEGNLTVNGVTTSVNSTEVNIGDSIVLLNSDEAGTPSANGGIEVERGTSTNASLLWNESGDYWQVFDGSTASKLLTAGNFATSFTGVLDGGTF